MNILCCETVECTDLIFMEQFIASQTNSKQFRNKTTCVKMIFVQILIVSL